MKRSRTAGLILMGTAPWLLSACSHEPDAVRSGLYTSVDACVAAGSDRTACTDAYVSAYRESKTAAPTFDTETDCEARYGRSGCTERDTGGGHSLFMPVMAGFMLAQAMRGNGATGAFRSAAAFRDPAHGWSQAPWMDQGKQPRNDNPMSSGGAGFYGGSGGPSSGSLKTVEATPDRASTSKLSGAQARTGWTTVERGGFGSGGAARGGFRGFGS
jgi:uncharacterized protein YgiB involved in biofilm formation